MEFKPFLLFLFVALISFGGYIVLQIAYGSLISSIPIISIITFLTIGTVMWFLLQYIMNMKNNKQAKANISAIILIAIIAFAGIFAIYMMSASNQPIDGTNNSANDNSNNNIVEDFTDWVSDGWNNLFNKEASATQLTIFYTDGTSQSYHSGNGESGLSIIDKNGGKTVSSLKIELYITPSWTSSSTITSYDVSGTVLMNLNRVTGQGIYTSTPQNIVPLNPKPSLISGQAVVISSATITAAQLEALGGSSLGTGDYMIIYANPSPTTVTLHFANGDSVSKSATAPQLTWVFGHTIGGDSNSGSSTFNSLSVTFWKTVQ